MHCLMHMLYFVCVRGVWQLAEGCNKDRAKSESLCSILSVFVLSDSPTYPRHFPVTNLFAIVSVVCLCVLVCVICGAVC
jgi:hypothetical protein